MVGGKAHFQLFIVRSLVYDLAVHFRKLLDGDNGVALLIPLFLWQLFIYFWRRFKLQ